MFRKEPEAIMFEERAASGIEVDILSVTEPKSEVEKCIPARLSVPMLWLKLLDLLLLALAPAASLKDCLRPDGGSVPSIARLLGGRGGSWGGL